MSRLPLVVLVVVLALAPPTVGASDAAESDAPQPHIVGLLPNPTAPEDRGEYVALSVPSPGPVTLTDGEATVNLTVRQPGRIVLTPTPGALPTDADGRVVRAPPSFRLSNAGERLRVRRGGRVVDELRYENAPEGERLRVTPTGRRWWPVGLTPRDPARFGPANATAFVLPDAPTLPVATLRAADDRVLLAGYTFTSARVADALLAAAERGVRVVVLVDGGPVGGFSRRSARTLDRLAAGGVRVRVVGGPRAPVSFHHAKYAVVDDRALVLTENWKPAGVGGNGSRGWGVRVASPAVASDLASVFEDDANGPGALSWRAFEDDAEVVAARRANGSYPERFEPATVRVDRVSVLTAPDNAESALVARIDAAEERVAVLQPTLGSVDQPLVRAVVRAARRGVSVRILLSEAWYVTEENRRLVRELNRLSRRESLPLEARTATPDGRFEKVHAKGLLVDDAVAVGSLNWNDHSAGENREVVLVLEGEAVTSYYRNVFDADWRGSGATVPVTFVLAGGGAALGAAVLLRREISFAD